MGAERQPMRLQALSENVGRPHGYSSNRSDAASFPLRIAHLGTEGPRTKAVLMNFITLPVAD